jgi:hypothetical protein
MEAEMVSSPGMKYVAVEIDLKARRVRIGSSMVWAIAAVVIGLAGHYALAALPLSVPRIWTWWRGK